MYGTVKERCKANFESLTRDKKKDMIQRASSKNIGTWTCFGLDNFSYRVMNWIIGVCWASESQLCDK